MNARSLGSPWLVAHLSLHHPRDNSPSLQNEKERTMISWVSEAMVFHIFREGGIELKYRK